jgi:hypothetical protein
VRWLDFRPGHITLCSEPHADGNFVIFEREKGICALCLWPRSRVARPWERRKGGCAAAALRTLVVVGGFFFSRMHLCSGGLSTFIPEGPLNHDEC